MASFFKGFLQNPKRVGAIMESSRFLVDKIMKHVELQENDCVVELGAGLGVVTERLLKILPQGSKLLTFELNPDFVEVLKKKFNDPRLYIIQDAAQNLAHHLKEHGRDKADIVVSIVPLKHVQAPEILDTVKACLKEGGRYVQVSLVGKEMLEEKFTYVSEEWVFLNIPPEKVHFCLNKGPVSPS